MRYNLTKKNSTKTERIVYEVLKELKIPFKHRWIVSGKEVDFIIGSYAIEIDGHDQDPEKNLRLVEKGYIPIHIHNSNVSRENIIKLINKLDYDYIISRRNT